METMESRIILWLSRLRSKPRVSLLSPRSINFPGDSSNLGELRDTLLVMVWMSRLLTVVWPGEILVSDWHFLTGVAGCDLDEAGTRQTSTGTSGKSS